ncbi:MAG: hypothetical protein AB7V15_00785 [Acidimicrobiia bacterium]
MPNDLELSTYRPTDPFFGAPYLDRDETRDEPTPHRYLHGGFEGTGTRFSLYFPPAEAYRGRFIQPLEGGLGGSEHSYDSISGAMGLLIGGFDFAAGLGAYMVESNQGHVGSELCPKAGDDATVYAYRASAETARFAQHLALQLYGTAPHHGYVFGGSGGSGRAAMCIEHVHDVWAGALTFMGATVAPTPAVQRAAGPPFSTLYNAQRVIGRRLADVVDALEPGGSGQPFEGLSTAQREALRDLYRSGFPRGVEYLITHPPGQIGLWGWSADQWYDDDPDYYDGFWSHPGYLGHDDPAAFEADLIVDRKVVVSKVVTARELGAVGALQDPDLVWGIFVDGVTAEDGFLQGSSIKILTGKAAGRQLWCIGASRAGMLLADGTGADGNARFADVEPGDEILLDNRRYLAYCYRYRHVVDVDDPAQSHLHVDGRPLFPQRVSAPNTPPPHMGIYGWTGAYTGKVLTVQHTHDSSIWPRLHEWPEGEAEGRWALQWLENAEHVPWQGVPRAGRVHASTRLIDWKGNVEQCLHDLVAWVEDGVAPARTAGTTMEPGGALVLAPTAAERGGIQPVVRAAANGGARAEVAVGEPVTLSVEAEVPAGAGTVIAVSWDFDGSGAYPEADRSVDGTASTYAGSITHAYAEPGTWFATARVTSHRDGDVTATTRRIENLARVRVVVR